MGGDDPELSNEQLDGIVARYIDYTFGCGTEEERSYKELAKHGFHGMLWAYPSRKGAMHVKAGSAC